MTNPPGEGQPPQDPHGQPLPLPGHPPQYQPGDLQPSGYGYGPPMPVRPPDHPRASTAMVLGIVSVAGGMLCYLPFFIAPFAWVMGGKAVREIDASQGKLGGRGMAQAGYILGIIGSILLGIALLVIAAFVAILVIGAVATSSTNSGGIPVPSGA